MSATDTQDTDESRRHGVVDALGQAIPIPSDAHGCPPYSTHPMPTDVPRSFGGTGGEFSGAGASGGWSDCASVESGATAAGESVGSMLIDAAANLLPF